jgi:hypothetical protein
MAQYHEFAGLMRGPVGVCAERVSDGAAVDDAGQNDKIEVVKLGDKEKRACRPWLRRSPESLRRDVSA